MSSILRRSERADRTAAQLALPCRFQLSAGALEALKWLALVSMVVDHVNGYVFDGHFAIAQAFGRLSFPLFALVLGYNLARRDPPSLAPAAQRMVVAGLVAQPFFALMVSSAWRLNIFFTLLAALGVIALAREPTSLRRNAMLLVLFVGAGVVVDYFWYGIALVVASYHFSRTQTLGAAVVLLATLGALTLFLFLAIGWPALAGLLAIPAVWYSQDLNPAIRRRRWLFYAFYPLHLAVLVCAATIVSSH